MTYENWKVSKADYQESEKVQEEYSKVAEWCNNSGEFQIQEIGDEYCVVKIPEPLPPTAEEIDTMRVAYRNAKIDNKTLARMRKQANKTWTEADEQAYLALDAEVTAYIEENYPYPVE